VLTVCACDLCTSLSHALRPVQQQTMWLQTAWLQTALLLSMWLQTV